MIRPATPADFPRLQQLEVAAGQAFREVGMPEIADHDPPSLEMLTHFTDRGRAWVSEEDVVGAYLLAKVLDGCAHIAQVSTDPQFRGRGLGRALIDHLGHWASSHHFPALTLTTFRDVPWNAPYYRRLGFVEVPATGALADEVAKEASLGLDPRLRVCMRRAVSPGR
ncbi:GNAT family N-acetyltransferase [Actinokineospora sp. UTMC 2448]|uniref:GNAT family N-acetyltransferase n=1 Tax=Actinokineospora sp. UTMC 2448 TaxID=2268449 RepID=UPI002164E833|nr:GNAT family N-acetyltransferase [Actinokineospora sp. UTMC 2448]